MFKEQYGKTIHRIITEKRIVQAKYLLEHSDANTSIIASSCGFGSCEDMVYAFKRMEGCSPSKYRKNSSSKQSNSFHIRGKSKFIRESKKENRGLGFLLCRFLIIFCFFPTFYFTFFTNIDMLNRLDTKCASSYNV